MRKMLDKKEIEKIIDEHGGEPEAYLKSANVNGNTLTLTNKDNTTVVFTPEGSSVEIDNKTLVENAQGKIETAIGGYSVSTPPEDYVDNEVNSDYASTSEPLFAYTGDTAGLVEAMHLKELLPGPNRFSEGNLYTVIVKVNGETVWTRQTNVAYNMAGPGGTEAILINAASGPSRISINTPLAQQGSNYFRIKVYETSSAMTFETTDVVTFFLSGPGQVMYSPIDGRFIPIDGTTITLNSNNQLQGFSGDYDDLTNKPTIPATVSGENAGGYWTALTIGDSTQNIPAVVSGVNDGTNWTSLTIGSNTYGIGGGSAPSNMVTTDTAQTISGAKTFSDTIVANASNSIELKANGYRGIYAKNGSLAYEDKIAMNSDNYSGTIVQTITRSAGSGSRSVKFDVNSAAASYYPDNSDVNLGVSAYPWANLYVNNSIQIGSTSLSEAQLQALLALLNQ